MEGAAAEGEAFPAVHAGVSYGPALRRWGDYYGSAVNRAARLAERARPSAVLADAGVRDVAAATTSASPGPTRAPSASRASRSPCRSCACG